MNVLIATTSTVESHFGDDNTAHIIHSTVAADVAAAELAAANVAATNAAHMVFVDAHLVLQSPTHPLYSPLIQAIAQCCSSSHSVTLSSPHPHPSLYAVLAGIAAGSHADDTTISTTLLPSSSTVVGTGAKQTETVLASPAVLDSNAGSSSTYPLFQTATFVQPNALQNGNYDYTRSGNPTRRGAEAALGNAIASAGGLAVGSVSAFTVSTGMTALSLVAQLPPPSTCLAACDDLYGGMHRLLTQVIVPQTGRSVHFVDIEDVGAVGELLDTADPPIGLLHIESPSNPLLKVADIRELASVCHDAGALLSVDNTMMCLGQSPLALGADIEIHSATKYLFGHADTMGGVVAVRDPGLAQRLAFLINAQGLGLAPFDAWLLLRSLRTLHVRVERAVASATALRSWLESQPWVASVNSTQASSTHHSQALYDPPVISFVTAHGPEFAAALVDNCTLFKIAVSFGSVSSVIELPSAFSHASISDDSRKLDANLVRISIGLESVSDLVSDLHQASHEASALTKTTNDQDDGHVQ